MELADPRRVVCRGEGAGGDAVQIPNLFRPLCRAVELGVDLIRHFHANALDGLFFVCFLNLYC